MINVVILATNIYALLGVRLIKQLNYRYKGKIPLHIHVFTDVDMEQYLPTSTKNVTVHYRIHNSWLNGTNSKFTNIVSLEKIMVRKFKPQSDNDYCYYIDADTIVVNDINETFFTLNRSHKFASLTHFICGSIPPENYPFERNSVSQAFVSKTDKDQLYRHATYLGGRTQDFVEMCKKLIVMQDIDQKINFEPGCNDESYVNRYLHDIRYTNQCKVWKCEDFSKYLLVSEKGGLENFRDVKNKPTEEDLNLLKENREKQINIVNGKIVVMP